MSKPFITSEQLDELLARAEKSKSAEVILRMDQFRDLVEQAKCARPEALHIPEGWRLVPLSATPAMIEAAHASMARDGIKMYADTYRAMVECAPSPLARSEPKGLPDYPLAHLPGCEWPVCDCNGRWNCKVREPQSHADNLEVQPKEKS